MKCLKYVNYDKILMYPYLISCTVVRTNSIQYDKLKKKCKDIDKEI